MKKLPEILKKPAGDGRWRASADHLNTRRFGEQNAAQADTFKNATGSNLSLQKRFTSDSGHQSRCCIMATFC
jgi:hypothetical protein